MSRFFDALAAHRRRTAALARASRRRSTLSLFADPSRPDRSKITAMVESLETRALLAVMNNLTVTSLFSADDTDGSNANNQVKVPAGSTVTANFSFTYGSSVAPSTTASFLVGPIGNPIVTTGNVVIDTNPAPNAVRSHSLSVVIPVGTNPGSYNARVQVVNEDSRNSTIGGSVEVLIPITVVETSIADVSGSGTYGDTATLSANFSPALAGKLVTFTHDTTTLGSAQTQADGRVTVPNVSLAGFNAGNHPIVASFVGDSTHSPSTGTGTLTVDARSVTPVIAASNKTYDGTTTATLSSQTLGGVLAADAANVGLTVTAANFDDANAGQNKTVTATGLGLSGTAAGNYTLGTTTSAITTADIGQADASVNVAGKTATYNGQAHGASGAATGVGGVDLGSGLSLGQTFVDAGTHTASWSFDGGVNYKSQSGTVTIQIDQAGSSVAVTVPTNAIYNGEAHAATAVWSSDTTAEGGVLTVSYERLDGSNWVAIANAPVNAGTYRATASFAGDANHTGSSATQIFTIAQATLTGSDVTVDIHQSTLNLEQKNGTITFSIKVNRNDPNYRVSMLNQVELLGASYHRGNVSSWTIDEATNTLFVTLRMDQVRADLLEAATTGVEASEWLPQGGSMVNNVTLGITGIADNFTVFGSDEVKLLVTKKFLDLVRPKV